LTGRKKLKKPRQSCRMRRRWTNLKKRNRLIK
jgi:hypothetical protein